LAIRGGSPKGGVPGRGPVVDGQSSGPIVVVG